MHVHLLALYQLLAIILLVWFLFAFFTFQKNFVISGFRVYRFLEISDAFKFRNNENQSSVKQQPVYNTLFLQLLGVSTLANATDFKTIPGCGIECKVSGVETVLLNSNNSQQVK